MLKKGELPLEFLGKIFGQLTVLEIYILPSYKKSCRRFKVKCLCSCGESKECNLADLKSDNVKSCGCWRKKGFYKEGYIGKRYGKLTVISFSGIKEGDYGSYWNCECDCGNKCRVVTNNLKNGHTKSCGCLTQLKGKEHWNYKTEISEEERKSRKRGKIKDSLYNEWRVEVFKRDNYVCQLTGSKKDIQAHHIYAWNDYFNLRYDVSNGITLSKEIHIKFHSLFGKGGNTAEQFEEFKKLMSCLA